MKIAELYRFPIKGLSAERLAEVDLRAGYGFPLDRVYAVTDGSFAFDEDDPKPAPKTQFLMLAKYEGLARLKTRFLESDKLLTIEEAGAVDRQFRLDVHEDCEKFADFLGRYVGTPLPGTPRLVHAEGHQFTDVSVHSAVLMRSISLINLATVRDLAEKLGTELDPIRFRGNVLFDGAPAWSELDWVGRTFKVGDVTLRIIRRTKRCAATSVNPSSALRDVNVPLGIRDMQGHGDLGVYAEVVTGGVIAEGSTLVAQD